MVGKKLLLAAVAALALTFTGCSEQQRLSDMQRVQKTLTEMETYACEGQLTRISNKGEKTYGIRQYYKNTGEYRLEMTAPDQVAGNYVVCDGDKIYQYTSQGGVLKDVPDQAQRNELFLGAFVKNYMQSEHVSVAVGNFDQSKCLVLEAVIPGDSKYLATEKLWVDKDTSLPVQLVIYDAGEKERYIVTYDKFVYNEKLSDAIFEIPQ